MAEKNFMEIIAETIRVTEEYSEIIIRAHEMRSPLSKDADAVRRLRELKDKLDVLAVAVTKLPDYDDRNLAKERIAIMRDALRSSLRTIAKHRNGRGENRK
ncbi:hypothetical protein IKE99_01155 [Candidatus Saccharibacteria bacterium]|nr:hypothetical protein [Candidatus Saccharibacteria bacterium]